MIGNSQKPQDLALNGDGQQFSGAGDNFAVTMGLGLGNTYNVMCNHGNGPGYGAGRLVHLVYVLFIINKIPY